MNGIEQWFARQLLQSEWAERIGWALFHSLWQMAVVAAVYAMLAYVLRNRAANVRYVLGCAALLAMTVLPMATVALVMPSDGADPTMAGAALPQVRELPNSEPIVLEDEAVLAPSLVADVPDSVAMLPASPPRESVNPSLMARGESRWLDAMRPWLPWATALWLLGVLLLSLRPLRGWLHVRRLQRHGLSPFPSELNEVAASLVRTLRTNPVVTFAMSAVVEVPTVVGYLRPMVLLPTSAVTGLTAAEIEMILAHELAHVRRHDYLVNLLQTVIESLLFYHPAMWWVSSQIRHERENCCDDIAVATNSRIDYARALTRLEEQRSNVRSPALAATGGSLLRRVRRLLGQPTTEFGYRNATAWLTGLATVSVVAVALAMGGEASDEGTPPLKTVGPSNSETAWGQPMNGLQCRLVAVPPETDDESPELNRTAETFSTADNLTFAVELKNVGDDPITLIGTRYSDSYGTSKGKLNTRFLGPHLFAFEFTDAEGKPIPRPARTFDDKSEVIILSGASTHELAPGESHTVLLRPAQFMAPMDFHLPPGEYRGKVHYLGPSKSALAKFSEFWPDRAQAKAWSEKITSNSVDFTIANVPNAVDPPQLVWGPEKDGLQAAIELVVPKGTAGDASKPPGIQVGSELDIIFHVKNVSDRVITLVSETARQGDTVRMTDLDGNNIAVKDVWYTGWPIDVRWNLKPGEEATLNLLTPRIGTDLPPGKYDVQYTIRFNSRRSKDRDGNITFPLPGDWQDELATGTAPLFLRAEAAAGNSSANPPVGNSGENTSTPNESEVDALPENSGDDRAADGTPSSPALTVQLRDADGKPVSQAYVTVWRALEPGEAEPVNRVNGPKGFGYYNPVIWDDKQHDARWVRERSAHPNDGRHSKEGAAEYHVRELPPGRYRVVVATYRNGEETPDPTPYGVSDPFTFDESTPQDVNATLMKAEASLTLRAVDAQTHEPITAMALRLRTAGGMPIVHGHGTGNFFEWTDDKGEVRFAHLPQGDFTVQVLGKLARVNNFVQYEPLQEWLPVAVKAGKNELDIDVEPRRLEQAEIDRRFPFSVFGQVADEEGHPLAGVEVRAATGMGTLMGGGRTTTDADGRYRLYFGPGMMMQIDEENAPRGVGVQAAQFYIKKPGWKLDAKDGYLFYLMTDRSPEQFENLLKEEGGKYWGKDSMGEVVFANQPRELNFVLIDEQKTPSGTSQNELRKQLEERVEPSSAKEVPVDDNAIYSALVIDAESGQPIKKFLVLPGTSHMEGFGWQWQPHLVTEFSEGAVTWPPKGQRGYERQVLRIEADGYLPLTTDEILRDAPKRDQTIRLTPSAGIAGRVLDPDGNPAANANVAVAMCRREVRIAEGDIALQPLQPDAKLRDRWEQPRSAITDADGRFRIPDETAPALLVVTHPTGVVTLSLAHVREHPELQLESWGKIDGQVLWGDTPGADVSITMSARGRPDPTGLQNSLILHCSGEVTTGDDGRFVFDKVPPGLAQISRQSEPFGEAKMRSLRPIQMVHVLPVLPTKMVFGGKGRPVVGKLVGRDDWSGVHLRIAPNAPRPGDMMNKNDPTWPTYTAFLASEAGKNYVKNNVKVNADGTFRIENVPPEHYQLFVSHDVSAEETERIGYSSFRVDTLSDGEESLPLDLGEIEIKAP